MPFRSLTAFSEDRHIGYRCRGHLEGRVEAEFGDGDGWVDIRIVCYSWAGDEVLALYALTVQAR